MARKTRVFVKDTPQYILLARDRFEAMFLEQEDIDFFLLLVRELVQECALNMHAYIILPHSFEFLATPHDSEVLSKFMQKLARRYVVFFSKKVV